VIAIAVNGKSTAPRNLNPQAANGANTSKLNVDRLSKLMLAETALALGFRWSALMSLVSSK
jgi:hypothetical protein